MSESSIQEAREQAQSALGQLDARYESDKDELRAQFSLAETDAEKSSLARALGELNRARDEGVKAIAKGFARARADVSGRADNVAAGVDRHAQGIGDLYRDASASISGSGGRASELAASFGVGANVGGRNIGAVDDLAAAAELAAAREQTLAGRLGNITVEDLRWLADNIGAQSQAAQAGLRGDAMGLSAGLMSEHANRVGDRIGRETSQWQAQLGALRGDFRQRGFQLEDQDIGLLAQLAQMRHATQLQREQIAAQERIAAANRAAAARRGGGGAADNWEAKMRLAHQLSQEEQRAMWAREDAANDPSDPMNRAGAIAAFGMTPEEYDREILGKLTFNSVPQDNTFNTPLGQGGGFNRDQVVSSPNPGLDFLSRPGR